MQGILQRGVPASALAVAFAAASAASCGYDFDAPFGNSWIKDRDGGADASHGGSAGHGGVGGTGGHAGAGGTGGLDGHGGEGGVGGNAVTGGSGGNGGEGGVAGSAGTGGSGGNGGEGGVAGNAGQGGAGGATCDPFTADCDKNALNGCEVDIFSDPLHCGSCTVTCASGAYATPICEKGSCAFTCEGGHGDCDASPYNGCESDFTSSTEHCGACNKPCPSVPNATPKCSSSVCGYDCGSGYLDCDNSTINGCESNSYSDPINCGACGKVCGTQNTLSSVCAGGSCALFCATGYGNCDKDASNGCELAVNTLSNCGTCGGVCGSLHASPDCSAGYCQLNCSMGWSSCDSDFGTGCETDIASSLSNCGGCGNVCSTVNATAVCSVGTCLLTCAPGYANCDVMPSTGCEAELATDPDHCGSCLVACDPSVPVCVAGQCVAQEPPGYAQNFPKCADLPSSISAAPVMDLRSWTYTGNGMLANSGSGGTAFDLQLGDGLTKDAEPQFVAGWPSFLSFDGADLLSMPTASNPPLLDSLHHDAATFTIVTELYLPSSLVQVIASTGSWNNVPGLAVYVGGPTVNLQVGDGVPLTGSCTAGGSLCVNGPLHGMSLITGKTLFVAFSINETSGEGRARLNGSQKAFPATYAGPASGPADHRFQVSGEAEGYPLAKGARLYRVRLWDVALDATQLDDLYQHSESYCFW
jgi:hypothetical protein